MNITLLLFHYSTQKKGMQADLCIRNKKGFLRRKNAEFRFARCTDECIQHLPQFIELIQTFNC